jgi:uncharacterized membrane protein
MHETLWYIALAGLGLLVFVVVCVLNIKIQRARLREEARMTEEELRIKRAEEKAFQGVWRRGR